MASTPDSAPPPKTEDQILEELLTNLPATEAVAVDLPSKNKFYKLDDPAQPITLRPMTFDDEKVVMSNQNVNQDTLNTLLSRCLSNISLNNLLQVDKLSLIMKLREISYGDEYRASMACPGCRRDNNLVFNLSKLEMRHFEEGFSNPQEIELPVLKKKVKVRLPLVEDEMYFQNADFAVANLWRFVTEVEGHSQKTLISKFVQKLPLQDAHIVINTISCKDYGLDTKVRFLCTFCSHNEIMELPITSDFFTGS